VLVTVSVRRFLRRSNGILMAFPRFFGPMAMALPGVGWRLGSVSLTICVAQGLALRAVGSHELAGSEHSGEDRSGDQR